jgi:hypothetical protein
MDRRLEGDGIEDREVVYEARLFRSAPLDRADLAGD